MKKRYISGFVILVSALIILFGISLISGSVSFRIKEVLNVLAGKSENSIAENIIMNIRLPRITASVLLGGALAVSGFLLQNFFGNPIAGPFVLGISSGAKLTVAITMVIALSRGFVISSAHMIISSFIGSLFSMGMILLISGRVKNMSTLIVAGVMIGYICSAVTDLTVNFAEDSNIVNLHNWSMGTFSGTDKSDVKIIAVITVISFVCAFMMSKPMSAYQLGETYAQNMGVNIKLFRISLILLSSIMSSCVTAFAGPVSFVGVAVPHLVKSLFGTAKPIIIIPACFLGGGLFCLFCDLIARTLFAPTELSISTVTAVFGVPVIIYIMLKRKK